MPRVETQAAWAATAASMACGLEMEAGGKEISGESPFIFFGTDGFGSSEASNAVN